MEDKRKAVLVIGARGVGGHEGGVEKFAEEFVTRLDGSTDTTVLCLDTKATRALRTTRIVQVPRLSVLGTEKALYPLFAVWLFLSRRFDSVLILGVNYAFVIAIYRMIFWRRARLFVRSGSVDYKLSKWSAAMKAFIWLSELCLRFADGVIAVAPSIQAHLRGRGIESILVRNGLERTPPTGLGQQERAAGSIVAVGRVTAQKNYGVLLRAAAILRSEISLTIVGGDDGSGELGRLQALQRELGSEVGTFVGAKRRDDVLALLSQSSLFVNCSLHEGMSNAVLEAIQMGAPILLSDIEANRDLALPEHFYFNFDDPEDLANKIRKALSSANDYIVSASLFDDWSAVIARFANLIQLAPSTGTTLGALETPQR
jgi:glycosyltransferase involved in cell wall biosynthesis